MVAADASGQGAAARHADVDLVAVHLDRIAAQSPAGPAKTAIYMLRGTPQTYLVTVADLPVELPAGQEKF